MDSELVTDSESFGIGDGIGANRPSLFRYTETFEDLCPWYLMAGMTYEEFWDGDCVKAKYYRKKLKLKREDDNFHAWLQGLYVYEAVLNASPVFNPLAKHPKPIPYRQEPIPLSEAERVQKEQNEKRRRLEAGKKAFEAMALRFNSKFEKKGGDE